MINKDPEKIEGLKKALKKRHQSARVSLLLTIWLGFVWYAVFGSYSLISLLAGFLVALVIQMLFPLPHRHGVWSIHVLPLIYLVSRFIWDMIRAGIHVAMLVVFARPRKDAILRCEMRTSTPEYITILAAMTSLIPGTIVLEVDRQKKVMYLHCLDVYGQGGLDGIREATCKQEARILRAVAPKRVLEETGLKPKGKTPQKDGVENG